MKLIIDIPKDAYDYIMGSGYFPSNFNMISEIRNGIPLPKGHGRIIDESKIDVITEDGDELITDAPTIIEADKAERSE